MKQNLLETFASQPVSATVGLRTRMRTEDSRSYIADCPVWETRLAYKILIKRLGTMHK